MKKIFPVILLFCALTGSSQVKKIRDIVGNWNIAGDKNAGASLQIVDSSTIILTYMGETKTLTDCKIDFTKSPAWFDFSTRDSSNTLRVKSLLQVIGDDMIKWQLFIDEERPPYFSSTKGELLYLKRSATRTTGAIATN
ncbi:MAG: hypothetical protein ABIT05_14060 [Chitinophagaceae bacterium]